MTLYSRIFSGNLCIIALATLAACGGGGGGAAISDTTGSANTSTVKIAGSVAKGLALPSATITFKCADTSSLTGLTDASGEYSISLPVAALPCLAQAVGDGGEKYHSIATAAGTVNITPLTELIVALVFLSEPGEIFTRPTAEVFAKVTLASVAKAQGDVRLMINSVADLSVISDLITSPFRAETKTSVGDSIDGAISNSVLALSKNNISTSILSTLLAGGALPSTLANQILTGAADVSVPFSKELWPGAAIGFGLFVNDVASFGNTLYVNSSNGMHTSSDGGGTWTFLGMNYGFRQGPNVIANGKLLVSRMKRYLPESNTVSFGGIVYDPSSSATVQPFSTEATGYGGCSFQREDGSIATITTGESSGFGMARSSTDLITWSDPFQISLEPRLCGFSDSGIGGATGAIFLPELPSTIPVDNTTWRNFWHATKLANGTLFAAGTQYKNGSFVNGQIGAVYKSTDSGKSWAPLSGMMSTDGGRLIRNPVVFGDILVAPVGMGGIGRGLGSIFVSLRDGSNASLTASPSGASMKSAAVSSDGVFVVTGDNGTIARGSNAAKSWVTVASGTTSTITTVGWGNGYFLAAVADGSIIKSKDGTSWSKVGSGISSQGLANAITYNGATWIISTQNRYYSPTLGSGVAALFESTDDGASWSTLFQGQQFFGLAKCNGSVYASTLDGRLLVKPNLLSNWADVPQLPLNGPGDAMYSVACGNGLLVRQELTALAGSAFLHFNVSKDNGRTWVKRTVQGDISPGSLSFQAGRWYSSGTDLLVSP